MVRCRIEHYVLGFLLVVVVVATACAGAMTR